MNSKAIKDGYFNKPVEVVRNGKTLHTRMVRAGDEFDYTGPKCTWITSIEEEPSLDKKEIMTQLRAKGIKFSNAAPIETLIELLKG